MSDLSYRLATEQDIPALLELWEQGTDWGPLSEKQWREWYVDTPTGPALIVIAVAPDGRLAGQLVLVIVPVSIAGQETRILRMSSPIVRKEYNTGSLLATRLLMGLAMSAAQSAMAEGFELTYTLPHHAWVGFFRRLPEFDTSEFDCVERKIDGPATGEDRLKGRLITAFGPEYEELWRKAQSAFGSLCMVVRKPDWLNFKYGSHLCIEVRNIATDELTGYIAVRKNDGLIADWFAESPAQLEGVMRTALRALREVLTAAGEPTDRKVKAMRIPALESALDALGFETVDFRFAMVTRSDSPVFPRDQILPTRWYITAGE